jgi:hypothetical protein
MLIYPKLKSPHLAERANTLATLIEARINYSRERSGATSKIIRAPEIRAGAMNSDRRYFRTRPIQRVFR